MPRTLAGWHWPSAAEDREIGVHGVQASQRIHFDEMHPPFAIAPDVDASRVSATEPPPDTQRQVACFRGHGVLRQRVLYAAVVLRFIGV